MRRITQEDVDQTYAYLLDTWGRQFSESFERGFIEHLTKETKMSDPVTTTAHRVQPYSLDDLDARIAEGSVDQNRLAATLHGLMTQMEQLHATSTAAAQWINEQIAAQQAGGRKGK